MADTKTPSRKPGKKRIMVQIGTKLAESAGQMLNDLHLKRDAYLSDLFRSEIEALAKEVTFTNTDEVRRTLQKSRPAATTKLTLEFDEDVVAAIDAVLSERNVPRDNFVARVFFYLMAPPELLDHLGITFEKRAAGAVNPLTEAKNLLRDPFDYIRAANDDRLYSLTIFEPKLSWLNVAVSPEDWTLLQGTDDLLDELFGGTEVINAAN